MLIERHFDRDLIFNKEIVNLLGSQFVVILFLVEADRGHSADLVLDQRVVDHIVGGHIVIFGIAALAARQVIVDHVEDFVRHDEQQFIKGEPRNETTVHIEAATIGRSRGAPCVIFRISQDDNHPGGHVTEERLGEEKLNFGASYFPCDRISH